MAKRIRFYRSYFDFAYIGASICFQNNAFIAVSRYASIFYKIAYIVRTYRHISTVSSRKIKTKNQKKPKKTKIQFFSFFVFCSFLFLFLFLFCFFVNLCIRFSQARKIHDLYPANASLGTNVRRSCFFLKQYCALDFSRLVCVMTV